MPKESISDSPNMWFCKAFVLAKFKKLISVTIMVKIEETGFSVTEFQRNRKISSSINPADLFWLFIFSLLDQLMLFLK